MKIIHLICVCVCMCVRCLPPAKRAPNSHYRYQPPHDGRFCRTFHEAGCCFVSPTRDQGEKAPGQTWSQSLTTPTTIPLSFPLFLSLSTDRDRRHQKVPQIISHCVPSFTSNPFILLICTAKQIKR